MNDINTLTEKLRMSCQKDLPGESAQKAMLAQPRKKINFPNSEEHAIPSAVLILLYHENDDDYFILTERTNEVQHHKGQISLPGGAWEEGEHLYETAMRETEEEIGIPMKNIEIISELTPLFINVTGYIIHPFVGFVPEIPIIIPHPNEVNNVFTASISDLLNPQNTKNELWTIRNTQIDVPFFKFGEYKVWGATAMILSEFKQCIKGVV